MTCSVCGSGVTQGTAQRVCNGGGVASTCLPLTVDDKLCANTPGTISSDGFDDVCNMVNCCNGGNTQAIELPSGKSITCGTANCTSICSLSKMQGNLGTEACVSSCTPSSPGRVCMFNAPAGANDYGYIGWAFQMVSTTTWASGSSEYAKWWWLVPSGVPAWANS